MKPHFRHLAGYNRWANARIYGAAGILTEEQYKRPLGVFFGSLHGTLNHLLVTDRIWLHRITGTGDAPARLDAILHENFRDLAAARVAEDERILTFIDDCAPEAFAASFSYRNMSGKEFHQPLADTLTHLFNHQTHHRGQAHACLSILADIEPPSLDLVAFQRVEHTSTQR